MTIAIDHRVNDTRKFGELIQKLDGMIQEGKLPQGIKPLSFLPSKDGTRGFCVWEAESVQTLRAFVDPLTGQTAINEYFEVNTEKAQGLPEATAAHTAA